MLGPPSMTATASIPTSVFWPCISFLAPYKMRHLFSLSIIWLLLTTALGVVGAYSLDAVTRAAANQSMVSNAALVASLCAEIDWQEPWESDPRWSNLEDRWKVDIVPLFSSPSSTDPQLVNRDEPSVAANTWTALPTGQWRISRSVAIATRTPTTQSIVGVRVTRLTDFAFTYQLWWSLWFVTFLLGIAIIAITGGTLRRHQQRKQVALQPWIEATRSVTDSSQAKLPSDLATDDDLAIQLSILRDAINHWLGELQSNLQRNELVLGNMQEGVLAVDDNSRVLLANAAVIRLLGVSTEAYLYRSLVEVVRAPRVVAIIERVLKSLTPQEESFEHGSELLSLRVLVRPVQLGNDRIGALMTVRDETLLKRIESVRRDFVTNASHELKTPLAAIRAYAETLQMGATEDPEATQTFLSGILSQADRINGLITGMLQLARVQAGNATLKRVRFEVQSEIESCMGAADVMAKAKQITLEKMLPTEPMFIQSDPEAVQTVVSNLLSNAVRYTPAGGHVSLQVAASNTRLTIRVRDTGIGIDKEELARIFERFYRVEKARTTDTGGTGLGLSIVKHLVQALEGSISVTSEPNVGSCFEVQLPLDPLD